MTKMGQMKQAPRLVAVFAAFPGDVGVLGISLHCVIN